MSKWIHCLLVLALCALPLSAAEKAAEKKDAAKPAKKAPPPKKKKRPSGQAYNPSMHGPFVGTALKLPNDDRGVNRVYRGILIPLNDTMTKGVAFDGDTMRMAAGWLNGGVVLRGLPFTGGHGQSPQFDGDALFMTRAEPGWADAGGSIADTREGDYPRLGNIPASTADFKGVYTHGSHVILSYTVNGTSVLEAPALETKGEQDAIVRHFEIGPHKKPLKLVAAFHKEAKGAGSTASAGETSFAVSGIKDASAAFSVEDHCVILTIPASKKTQLIKLYYAKGNAQAFVDKDATPAALAPLTKGGDRQWTETIKAKGTVSTESKAYVVDKIALPFDNPYGTKVRVGAFDFFSDGTRAALCTWDGDVWIVSGIDAKLENLEWTRFASGGHEPLGLKIVDDVIYTVDDAQITRYHDLNNDGQADFYENFNNDWDLTEGFHAFCFDLHTDKSGDFYFSFGAPVRGGGRSFERLGRHHGSILKVSKDGKTLERYASGFRAPNGIGVSPDGQVTSGDNEGTFVPRSPINWIPENGFGGVIDTYEKRDDMKTTASKADLHEGRPVHLEPSEMPKPLVWLPKSVDNSGGGQAWVTSDKWGPFQNRMLHLSYGRSAVYLVMHEEKDGVVQGGVTQLPVKLSSSAMRARVNPADGQVYVSGLKGWQTNAAKEGGLDRIRYTGKPVNMVSGIKVLKEGLLVEFTTKLDDELANDVTSYSVKGKKITWSSAYGTKEQDETFTLTGAKLQDDGKSVLLEISDIRPVHMLEVSVDVETADEQDELFGKIWSTIHFVN